VTPTISLCMIVKNEEPTLQRCLGSVAGIPDEIVIVDTGSDDATKAVAATFTSRVVDFDWVDDFSAARNYAFAQATMEWIMWLDADDVLLPDDRTKLLRLKDMLGGDIDAVSTLYHTAFDESGNVLQTSRLLRLVRRSKNFTWSGVVHETLRSDTEFRYLNSDIVVTHKKPAGRSEAEPSRRNLEIYEKQLSAGRQLGPADVLHYARELQKNGEFAAAIPQYRQFLEWPGADLDVALLALHKLATCYGLVGDLDKERECTLESLALDVPRPEFSCRFAERFLHRNQFRQAIFWYELALQDPSLYESDAAIENYPFKTWLPHKQLGLCYYRIGDYQRSLHHNQLAHQYLPDDPDIATNIRFLERRISESTGTALPGEE
jgi:glycosyltransferase involved in cell wall biosynthesis